MSYYRRDAAAIARLSPAAQAVARDIEEGALLADALGFDASVDMCVDLGSFIANERHHAAKVPEMVRPLQTLERSSLDDLKGITRCAPLTKPDRLKVVLDRIYSKSLGIDRSAQTVCLGLNEKELGDLRAQVVEAIKDPEHTLVTGYALHSMGPNRQECLERLLDIIDASVLDRY